MRWLFVVNALVAASSIHTREAEACSAPVCLPPYFTPTEGGTVPSNLPMIYWRPMGPLGSPSGDPQLLTLTTAADPSTPLGFTATKADDAYLLVPDEPLVASTTYVFTDNNTCAPDVPGTPPTRTFQAAASAALPTSLGSLSHVAITGQLDVWTSSGSCTTPVDASYVAITLSLSPDALPWRDALHYETLVDGIPWSGAFDTLTGPNPGHVVDTIYRVCASTDPGAATGVDGSVHEISVRATLPGTTVSVTTPPLTIQLLCSSDPDPMDPDPMTPPDPESSGGCTTTSPASSGLVLIALALAGRRRRRGSRSTTSR